MAYEASISLKTNRQKLSEDLLFWAGLAAIFIAVNAAMDYWEIFIFDGPRNPLFHLGPLALPIYSSVMVVALFPLSNTYRFLKSPNYFEYKE
jgi:hypothetical protein